MDSDDSISRSRAPSLATLVVVALILVAAGLNLVRIPTALHEAVDLRRAERWARGERADQAAFVLTMLHRAHPESARIEIALVRAQQQAGDLGAMEKTFEELQARDADAAESIRSELGTAQPSPKTGQGGRR